MTKYKCGHESKLIITDSDPVSMAEYFRWQEENKDNELCWECWCKQKGVE